MNNGRKNSTSSSASSCGSGSSSSSGSITGDVIDAEGPIGADGKPVAPKVVNAVVNALQVQLTPMVGDASQTFVRPPCMPAEGPFNELPPCMKPEHNPFGVRACMITGKPVSTPALLSIHHPLLANVAICLLSLHGKFIDCNDEFCRSCDTPKEEIVGTSIFMQTHPDDRLRLLLMTSAMLEGKMSVWESNRKSINAKNEVFSNHFTLTTVKVAGHPLFFVGFAMPKDISRVPDIPISEEPNEDRCIFFKKGSLHRQSDNAGLDDEDHSPSTSSSSSSSAASTPSTVSRVGMSSRSSIGSGHGHGHGPSRPISMRNAAGSGSGLINGSNTVGVSVGRMVSMGSMDSLGMMSITMDESVEYADADARISAELNVGMTSMGSDGPHTPMQSPNPMGYRRHIGDVNAAGMNMGMEMQYAPVFQSGADHHGHLPSMRDGTM